MSNNHHLSQNFDKNIICYLGDAAPNYRSTRICKIRHARLRNAFYLPALVSIEALRSKLRRIFDP